MKRYLRAFVQPGIGVKRWSVVVFTGVAFISLGTAFALSKPLSGPFIEILRRITLYDLPQLVRGSIFFSIGIAIAFLGAVKLYINFSKASQLASNSQDTILSLYENQRLSRGPRIVAIGGGTGLSTLLRGIKDHTRNITAIVAITDDGGSSGRLREEFEIPPPGDARACLAALSSAEPLLQRLFLYRFGGDSGLGGHSLGNLMLTAMSDIEGGFQPALDSMAHILGLHGRVVSVSDSTNLVLVAKTQSGSVLTGESAIGRSSQPIASVWIEPSDATPNPAAIEAIRTADLIVMGPGSIYTSIIPNLLLQRVRDAITASSSPKVFVCNVATELHQTDGYGVGDHLAVFQKHSGVRVSHVLVNTNTEPLPTEWKQMPVPAEAQIEGFEGTVVLADVVDTTFRTRHDSQKLARALLSIARG